MGGDGADGGSHDGKRCSWRRRFVYFGEKINNGLKWVMNTSTHKFGSLTPKAVIKNKKPALVIDWGPSYEHCINKKIHCW